MFSEMKRTLQGEVVMGKLGELSPFPREKR